MEDIESIAKKLYEIADTFGDGEYFTLRLLEKEGLGMTAIAFLYDEGIDFISYGEAIDVAKSDREKKEIKRRRRRAIAFRVESPTPTYIPETLLENPVQYCEILSNRDVYISSRTARKRLKLERRTMERIIKKRDLSVKTIQREQFIFVRDFRDIQAWINGGLPVKNAIQKLNIQRQRFYKYVDRMNIRINNGRIAIEDVERIASAKADNVNKMVSFVLSNGAAM